MTTKRESLEIDITEMGEHFFCLFFVVVVGTTRATNYFTCLVEFTVRRTKNPWHFLLRKHVTLLCVEHRPHGRVGRWLLWRASNLLQYFLRVLQKKEARKERMRSEKRRRRKTHCSVCGSNFLVLLEGRTNDDIEHVMLGPT